MKVLGFAIIAIGLFLLYVGITGSQHRLMAIITGHPAVPSGLPLNNSGKGNVSKKQQLKKGVQGGTLT